MLIENSSYIHVPIYTHMEDDVPRIHSRFVCLTSTETGRISGRCPRTRVASKTPRWWCENSHACLPNSPAIASDKATERPEDLWSPATIVATRPSAENPADPGLQTWAEAEICFVPPKLHLIKPLRWFHSVNSYLHDISYLQILYGWYLRSEDCCPTCRNNSAKPVPLLRWKLASWASDCCSSCWWILSHSAPQS